MSAVAASSPALYTSLLSILADTLILRLSQDQAVLEAGEVNLADAADLGSLPRCWVSTALMPPSAAEDAGCRFSSSMILTSLGKLHDTTLVLHGHESSPEYTWCTTWQQVLLEKVMAMKLGMPGGLCKSIHIVLHRHPAAEDHGYSLLCRRPPPLQPVQVAATGSGAMGGPRSRSKRSTHVGDDSSGNEDPS